MVVIHYCVDGDEGVQKENKIWYILHDVIFITLITQCLSFVWLRKIQLNDLAATTNGDVDYLLW